jgi:hypothetical protein
MATILLYSASISQTGTTAPAATDGSKGSALTSGSWARLGVGSYKFTRGSGNYFVPFSGSVDGTLIPALIVGSTSSISMYLSGSDSSSLYLKTYLPNNSTYTPADGMLSGNDLQISVNITY